MFDTKDCRPNLKESKIWNKIWSIFNRVYGNTRILKLSVNLEPGLCSTLETLSDEAISLTYMATETQCEG